MIDSLTIEINGNEHKWRFNNYALVELAELVQTDPSETISAIRELAVNDFCEALTYLIYAGIEGYKKQHKRHFQRLKLSDIAQEISNREIADFESLVKSFNDSVRIGKFLTDLKLDKRDQESEPKKEPIKFEEVYEHAIGEIGLLPHEFLSLNWWEYSLLVARNIKQEAKSWQHTRLIAYWIYLVNAGEDRETITDFMPLITDPEPEEAKPLTQEEKDRIFAEIKTREEAFKKIKNGG